MTRVHSTAIVDPRARLADDVVIGPYVVIGPDVELAGGVEIVSHVHLMGRTRIGARTRVLPFAVLGCEAQVRAEPREATTLDIGEDNIIREHVTIHAGTRPGGAGTRIGHHNLIMNNAHVAHDCRVGSHCELAAFAALSGHVTVDDHAVLGGKSGIHQHVRVGESAFAAGGSILTRDALPFSRVAGDRARFVGLNTLGLVRRSFSRDTIAQLKHAMHVLFHSKLLLEPAIARVARDCGDCPEVARLLGFLASSQRGFAR